MFSDPPSPSPLVPHRDDLNVRPVITSREIIPRRIILSCPSLGAHGVVHPADDSPIIRSPLKFDLITERDRTRRWRDVDDNATVVDEHEKEQQRHSRSTYTLVTVVPEHRVTTPLLRGTVAPRLSKPRGICARIRFWIARRLGRPYERIALPRRIFCRIANSETLATLFIEILGNSKC